MKPKYAINLRALCLSFLLFFAFAAKEMHHLVGHHHHEVKVCDAKNGEKHLHDQEYIPEDCSLCDFTFSIFDFTLPSFSLSNAYVEIDITLLPYHSILFSQKHFFKPLRGPPTFLS